jgi:hypothetical protein
MQVPFHHSSFFSINVTFLLVLCIFFLCNFFSNAVNVKRGTVYIDGPKHKFFGNVSVKENLQTHAVSCHFEVITHYEATTRYKISFFPYIKQTIDKVLESIDTPFGNVMHTIYNKTLSTQDGAATFQINNISNSIVSLSRGNLTAGTSNSIIGRTLAIESCELKTNENSNKKEDYCKVIAHGVIGIAKVNLDQHNIASGSLFPWEKSLACFLSSGNNAVLNRGLTHGSLFIKRRNDEQYVYENWLRISNVKFGGSTHALRLQTIGDLPLNEYGTVYDLEDRGGMPGFPCATNRRIGDMGDVPSTPDGDGSYRSIFKLPADLTDLLGRSCVLYRKMGTTCEAWDEKCTTRNVNNDILSRGIIGLAEPSMLVSVNKVPDYDCASLVTSYAYAKLRPFTFGIAKPISGYVEFFAANTDDGEANGVNHISLQIKLKDVPVGTTVNNGIGILRYGESLNNINSRIPTDFRLNPSKFERFDPYRIAAHNVPPYARRVGDLGNIQKHNVTNIKPTVHHLISFLSGGSSPSIQDKFASVIGRTFVVYQNKDNGANEQPNGNVGLPWAWGIIGTQLKPPSPSGSPSAQANKQAVTNVAQGATENDDTKHLVAEMIPTNGEVVNGIVELDLIDNANLTSMSMSPGNLVFQAYGKFKLLSPQTPYQWLILKPGVINTESESTAINDDNVLVKNSLFPMGKRVPDCETSVPTDDLKTYHRSLNKIGNFGILVPSTNSTNGVYRADKIWERKVSISTLGTYAGLTVVLARLDKFGGSRPKVVASGILGIANYPRLSTPFYNRKSTSTYVACNDGEVIPTMYKGFAKTKLIFTEEIIALLVGLGVAMFVVSIAGSVAFFYYNKKKKLELETEGPRKAMKIDDGPPPPPVPKEHDADDMEQRGYTSVINPMTLFAAEQNKPKEMELTTLRKRTNTLSRKGLPIHPSKKNLKAGKSFYNPRKLETARSVHRMNKAVSQHVLFVPESGKLSNYMRTIREKGSLSATNVGTNGRSFIHLPTKNGGTRVAKIGPPKRTTVARRGLPTHPSMVNVKSQGSKPMRQATKKQRRATRRHSEVETLVGWDQLNLGVRSSVVGKFLSEEEMSEFAAADLNESTSSNSEEEV